MDDVQELPNELLETTEQLWGRRAQVVWLFGIVNAFPQERDRRPILAALEMEMDACGSAHICNHVEQFDGHRLMMTSYDGHDPVVVFVDFARPTEADANSGLGSIN